MVSPPPSSWQSPFARALGLGQGIFYAVTGLWPILHLSSFMALSGPKTDTWLVQTVGGLLTVTGLALVSATLRRRLNGDWALLAGGQAACLATIDIVFVAKDRIAAIYLADALAELLLLAAWIIAAVRARSSGRS